MNHEAGLPADPTRRMLLRGGGIAGAALLLFNGCRGDSDRNEETEKKGGGKSETAEAGGMPEVTPTEDLMREHGLLNRVLLIYDEAIRRLTSGEDLPIAAVAGGADTIRKFIEEYHEKLEEDHIFPRFKNAGALATLADVLHQQHDAGRKLTDRIIELAKGTPKSADDRRTLADLLRRFNYMYRPHEAREDTVLFPALRSVVSPHEYDALGEDFEKKEHEMFGEDGFERMVATVASYESMLGIDDLAKFTPAT